MSNKFVIPESLNEWSEMVGDTQYRTYIRLGFPTLFKKVHDSALFGGGTIHCIMLGDDRGLAKEWLQEIKEKTGKTLVNWNLDDNGNF